VKTPPIGGRHEHREKPAIGSPSFEEAAMDTQTLTRPVRPAPADQEPINILLIDDDPDCRLMVRDAIADGKTRNMVFEVSNAEEGLAFLKREAKFSGAPRPGLIYLDIEMPGINGIELLKKIKADPELRNITVVMMTGVSDEEQMRLAAAAGANSYTIKPANAQQFLKTVTDSTNYWLTIHQYPDHHLPSEACRR
jgi:two-component system response regulator